MVDDNALLLEALMFALPLLGYPALIVAELIVAAPVLHHRGPLTERRRTAATVLSITCLVAAAPLLLTVWALGFFGALLLAGLAVPAVLTLTRLPRLPTTGTTS